jgi:DNA-binding NarL/FixJ family response regulator
MTKTAEPVAIRCVVADDHPAVLKAVCDFFKDEGLDVVAEAVSGDEALRKIEAMKPDVAVVDLNMPGQTGIEVARAVAERRLPTAVLLYTGSGDQALLAEAVDAGARGFLFKESPLSELMRAVHAVVAGAVYVDPILAGALVAGRATGQLVELTEREREVLRLLGDGLRYEAIGERLFISPETVRVHVRKAMSRLNASSRTQAVAEAIRLSLIA